MLGTKPDADVGRIIGRPGKQVWAKRKVLGISAPPSLVRLWTKEEDQIVLTRSLEEAARLLGRTRVAVKIRRWKLHRRLNPDEGPKLLTLEEVMRRIEVSRYDSKEQEEKVRLVDGPYIPPILGIGAWLS